MLQLDRDDDNYAQSSTKEIIQSRHELLIAIHAFRGISGVDQIQPIDDKAILMVIQMTIAHRSC